MSQNDDLNQLQHRWIPTQGSVDHIRASHLSHGTLVCPFVNVGVECKVANNDGIEFAAELLYIVLEVWIASVNDAGLWGPEEVLDGYVEGIDDEERVREKVDNGHVLIDALDLVMMSGWAELNA